MGKYRYFSAFILPALVVAGAYAGGWWNFTTAVFVFGVLTVADHLLGLNTQNVPQNEAAAVGEEYFYRFITYCWTYLQVGLVVWGAYMVASGRIITGYEWIGFVLGLSLATGGIGITVAHELGHKKSRIEKIYSKLLLMTVCYMHFYIEHNRGHHVHVATPQDPATGRRNENFFSFWVRCVTKSYTHAWSIENESWRRKGKSPFTIKNEMFWFTVLPLLFCGALTAGLSLMLGKFAWQVPVFFFSQSLLAFTLLELVDYIEHYGIVRKQLSNGVYERVNPLHSWNASHKLSNYFLFQLQRHSDHHYNAIKRYQVLNHHNESPQLPFGYPTMILIALFPPLWFKIMNPLLKDWSEKIYNPMAAAA
jgi:alkane 1-monooxygenase